MVSSRKVLICLLVVLSFSTLSLSQTNGQKTKPSKDSIPALKPPTLLKSFIEMNMDTMLGSESESDYDPIPPSDSKSSMPPSSGSASAPQSTTHSKASMSPSPSSESDDGLTPNSKPKPSSEPDSESEPPTEPDDGPAPSSNPKPSPTPSSEPDSETEHPTESDNGFAPSSKPKPSPSPSSKAEPPTKPDNGPAPSFEPDSSPTPSSKPKPAPEPSSAPTESDNNPNSTTGPTPEPKPTDPALNPKQGSKSPPQPTPSEPTTKSAFPYQTVNNFCLYKRLSVNRIFCLKVLKKPKAANATADDYTPLLQVAIQATTRHVIKTLKYLITLYKDKKADPAVKPSIKECVIAYQEIAEYIKFVLADASQESAIAGLDGQVIVQDINRCVMAMPKSKNTEIGEMNKIARNYATLLGDIADNP
ncbi:uncharacterized protein [Primulina huaijiensis]|uniref:uncharacterized protein n=1 Tax=Primulina huaijiensis TaxID=1492673 RepID=UPI003CC750E8